MNLYYNDKGKCSGLSLIPKLTFEHLHLTTFSKMRVDLAVQVNEYQSDLRGIQMSYYHSLQVLSESVAKALILTGNEKILETAHFIRMFDKFLNIMNVRNFDEGVRNRKTFLRPYHSGSDWRLKVSHAHILS